MRNDPIARPWGVTLDCPDPLQLAEFYQRIGGGRIVSATAVFAHLQLDGMSVGFQMDPDHRPPTWPDPAVPQQCHLDFSTPDLDTAQARAVAAGAVLSPHQPEPDVFRVLIDPAGHPFCLSTWGTEAGPQTPARPPSGRNPS
ncbi:VOC family protein [Pseudonocardia sp. CA-107938]|uniref:VOC family protein n=1 Tax=Pseudonocardia sp. CA-107938 TaxID=3240021 RepID=UPI003D8FEFFC